MVDGGGAAVVVVSGTDVVVGTAVVDVTAAATGACRRIEALRTAAALAGRDELVLASETRETALTATITVIARARRGSRLDIKGGDRHET